MEMGIGMELEMGMGQLQRCLIEALTSKPSAQLLAKTRRDATRHDLKALHSEKNN